MPYWWDKNPYGGQPEVDVEQILREAQENANRQRRAEAENRRRQAHANHSTDDRYYERQEHTEHPVWEPCTCGNVEHVKLHSNKAGTEHFIGCRHCSERSIVCQTEGDAYAKWNRSHAA